jgi:2-dehydropantoate 2-reductase
MDQLPKQMKKYAIIGTGAVGGYVAVKLSQAGFGVHCLLRSNYLKVKNQGLTLISEKEKVTILVASYQDISQMPDCDYVIIAVKTTENSSLKDLLLKIIKPKTIVVLIQNGIGMEQELSEFIDPGNIIGATTMLKVNKEPSGAIRHFDYNLIEFAQYYEDSHQEGATEPVLQLQQDFAKAGFDSVASRHLPTIRWKKLAVNIPISGLSVILNASTQSLIGHQASFQLLCDLTKEVIIAAEKSGAKLPADFYQYRLNSLESIRGMRESYFSMKEDFDAKHSLELHAIYENALSIAKQNNAAMPLTNMIYNQLCYLNDKNLAI